MPQYNDPTYDTVQYDISTFSPTYTDSLTETDAESAQFFQAAHTESLSETDTLVKNIQPLKSETITDSDSRTMSDSITRTETITDSDALSHVWTALLSFVELMLVGQTEAQYNSGMYNQFGYNNVQIEETVTFIQAPSVESTTLSDTLSKQPMINKTESLATTTNVTDADYIILAFEMISSTDSVLKNDMIAALMDSIGFIQAAPLATPYNGVQYNQQEYNERKFNIDAVTFADFVTKSETLNAVDVIQNMFTRAPFVESISSSDSLSRQPMPVLNEFVFFDTFTRVEITNKALNEILRLNDWLSINHTPFVEYWGD